MNARELAVSVGSHGLHHFDDGQEDIPVKESYQTQQNKKVIHKISLRKEPEEINLVCLVCYLFNTIARFCSFQQLFPKFTNPIKL